MQRTNYDQLILVDPVDDEDAEDSSTDWSSKRLTMCDLKKRKNVIHSSWSNRSSLYFFIGLANIFNVITDYLPFVN
jgi:hypothetical protein